MSTLYFHFLTFSLFIYFSFAQISDKRLCADLECNSPVSRAKTLGRYFSPDKYRLSFEPNEDILIFSKSAGSDESLWGAEIKGKRGYIPKSRVRETKKLATPTFLVDTEITNIPTVPQVPLKEDVVNPSKVKQIFEVSDGTTIYMDTGSKDVASSQDSSEQKATETLDSTKIDNDPTNLEINVATEIPSNEEPIVVESTEAGIISEPVNTDVNSEKNKVPTESQLISSEDVISVLDDNQLKEEIVNSNITSTIENIKDENADEEKEASESDNSFEDHEILNPFAFVSNAIKDVLGGDVDEGFIKEKKEELKEDNSASTETNTADSNKESEVQIELSSTNISSVNQQASSSFSENNSPKGELPDSQLNNIMQDLNTQTTNSPDADVDNVKNIPFFPDNEKLLNENSISTDKPASQSSQSIISGSEASEMKVKEDDSANMAENKQNYVENSVDKTASQDSENIKSGSQASEMKVKEDDLPNVTESKQNDVEYSVDNPASQDYENIKSGSQASEMRVEENDAESQGMKIESQNLLNIKDNDVPSNSAAEIQNVVSSLLAEKAISSQFTNTDKEMNNSPSSNIEIANENVSNTVENNLPPSVEIKSNTEEVQNANQENKMDVNIPQPLVGTEEQIGVSDNGIGSSQSGDLTNTQNNDNKAEKIIQVIQKPTENTHHYDYYNSKEQNDTEGHNNMLRYEPVATEEMPIINVDYVKDMLDHEQIQNVHNPDLPTEINEHKEKIQSETNQDSIPTETPSIFSYFGHSENEKNSNDEEIERPGTAEEIIRNDWESNGNIHEGDHCTKEDCPNPNRPKSSDDFMLSMDLLNFSSDVFLYLVTTAVSVIIFLLGHFALDKSRREGPLLAKINKLEKEFLILLKEKEILVEQVENKKNEDQHVDSEEFLNLQQEKEALEEKVQYLEDNVQTLEKELENSTEVGLELNRMLSEVLNSENAGQTLMLNIEGLQAQLAEQQGIVSSMKEVLSLKETENHELNLELDIANKKVLDLQSELDKLLSNIIKLEEDKESVEKNTEREMVHLKSTISSLKEQLDSNQKDYTKKIEELNNDLSTSEHNLQLKTKEFEGLKKSMQQIKDIKNANTLESLLEVNSIKAELEQLKSECQGHCDRLRKEKETNSILEKKVKSTEEEIDVIKTKFDETDKTRLELETKLQVLTNYFKEKEEQLQKELSKYESMWSAKQGEATSTSERIKYLQSEVQNYKAQNETLKQEIVSQEVELKGQISVLEKKVHENWVSARQAERRLEELKQEAAQLRNRLTLRERTLQDDRLHNRMQSPLEQTGDLPISPLHLESPASPPLLYNSRDHMTKSPPILGMPPPFLPPPTGSSFLPPPPPTGASYLPPPPLPFMPPPPHDMFPGDHRPPPLGRMSSPPLNSRYSPSRPYSPYDRSPSPSYDESEYGTSPVHRRNYSQFNRRRDHRPAAMEKFNGRSGTLSSGSENSNESLDELNHQNSKV